MFKKKIMKKITKYIIFIIYNYKLYYKFKFLKFYKI